MQVVINTFGASLRKQGDRFSIKAGDKHMAISAHKVQGILIMTGAHLSTDAIELASQHNIDIVFLSKYGEPYGRVWQTRMGSTAAIRRRQLEVAETAGGLDFIRGWVQAKVRHQLEFLEELSQRRPDSGAIFDSPMNTLRDCLAKFDQLTGNPDELRGTIMGLEGTAGRVYFGCLSKLVPEAYRFDGRSRHPAHDAFNAMLNYSYGVLYSLVERACICAGLDPFVGFLHTDNYNKKSLIYDLIEPFRILGDRTTLLLFTGRRVQQDFCEPVPGGVTLAKPGRAMLIEQLNERLDKTVRYPVQGKPGKTRNVKERDIIQHEAHALANRLLGKTDIPQVLETRQIWADAPSPSSLLPEDVDNEEPGERGPDGTDY